ncbi:MAG: hypothetical protein KDD66_01385 [Bdellovibrionales bacterium]|nr:hypothetical protein [Bdellovibrionales bacterium]
MNRPIYLLMLVVFSVQPCLAQVREDSASEADATQPRFMLKQDADEADEDVQQQPAAEDFEWERLVEPAAAGMPPVIGDRDHAAYYDFQDGQTAPFYFTMKE